MPADLADIDPSLRGIYECRIIGASPSNPHLEGRVGGFIKTGDYREFVVLDAGEVELLGIDRGSLPVDSQGDALKNGVMELMIRNAHNTDDVGELMKIKGEIAERFDRDTDAD